MANPYFVSREPELARLDVLIKDTQSGKGSIFFISGEAGSGKTTLVTEFARRAQEQNPILAVAVGQSDAQTGNGDAHLPFREVLGQLTGDVDSKLAQGAISSENAKRLQRLLAMSGEILMDVGPDLVDLFVPGGKIITRAGTLLIDKVGWLDKLKKISDKKGADKKLSTQGIEQSQIFEQYANVLCKLSDKSPLLIVLDDLQWADNASIELLFRLARRIEGHKIMLLGTYRQEDIAMGRLGDRHPMEKVLAELKRYYGDICLDLNQVSQVEGKQFVDAFINSEPNLLGENFRLNLFKHTGGQPLFTIELLRNMQERGDLVKDEQGRWIVSKTLTWNTLPKRVEGVIEERIGRLEPELRRTLAIASVEGEEFTAEIVARVQAVDVRALIARLGGELENQHRLIVSTGMRRLDTSGQRISIYRFHHSLIQKYMYNQLSDAERGYLHEDIGTSLEELYGDQVDEIVVQLARHFDQAQMIEKARLYLKRAGDQAATRYANEEALAYYNRALDLTPKDNFDEYYSILLSREQIYDLSCQRELQAGDLVTLVELVKDSRNNQKRAEVTLRRAKYALEMSDYAATISESKGVIHLAGPINDCNSLVTGYYLWGVAMQYQGQTETAQHQIDKALTLSRQCGLRYLEADSLRALGAGMLNQGNYGQAKQYLEESLNLCHEDGNQRGEGKILNNLGAVCNLQGDYAEAIDFYRQALSTFQRIGDRKNENLVMGNLGLIAILQGDLLTARHYFEQSLLTSRAIGDRENESFAFVNLGDVSAMLDEPDAAEKSYRNALLIIREIGFQRDECIALHKLAQINIMIGEYSTAGELCAQALQLARKLQDPWCEAEVLNRLGMVCDRVGYYLKARESYEKALQIINENGIKPLESEVLSNLGLLDYHLGDAQAALINCRKALDCSRELNARIDEARALTNLGHALVGIGNLEEALKIYETGLQLRRDMGQLHLTGEPLAGLARIYILKGQIDRAMDYVAQILEVLENHTLGSCPESMQVSLTCYQVLKAKQDSRSDQILRQAQEWLQERARRINNANMRKSFLEKVAINLEITKEFTKVDSSRMGGR